MKFSRTILIFVMLVSLPMLVFAQDDLSETYTSGDGSLSFNYPAGWRVEDFGQVALMSSDRNLYRLGEFDSVPPGTTFARIATGVWGDILPTIDISGSVTAMDVVQQIANDPSLVQITEEPAPLDMGQDAALLGVTGGGTDILAIVIVVDDENGVLFVGGAVEGEIDMYRDTLIAIATSIIYSVPEPGAGAVTVDNGPPAITGTGPVLWQQQRYDTFDGIGFGDLGTVDVAPDGMIYVADGLYGIRVLDASGSVIGTIINNNIASFDSIVVAEDGTLWTLDAVQRKVHNLSPDGTLISTFGERGNGPGQFGAASPGSFDFDIGPDGNLYIFDGQSISNTPQVAGRIQVFDVQGDFIREFPIDPNDDGTMSNIVNIAVGQDGNIFVAEFNGTVQIIDPQGNIINESVGDGIFIFNSVWAINSGPKGSMYAVTGNGVYILDGTGELIAQFGLDQPFPDKDDPPLLPPDEFAFMSGIGIAPNGDAIVAYTNTWRSQIIRISVDELIGTP